MSTAKSWGREGKGGAHAEREGGGAGEGPCMRGGREGGAGEPNAVWEGNGLKSNKKQCNFKYWNSKPVRATNDEKAEATIRQSFSRPSMIFDRTMLPLKNVPLIMRAWYDTYRNRYT